MSWTALSAAFPTIAAANASAISNMWSTSKTNKTNKQIAAQNNETAINLANTAHQREVADLQAAGLNPILSAGGQGAATPSLQQAEMKAPQFDSYAITDAIRALAENEKAKAEIKNLNQDTENKETQREYQKLQNRIATVQAEIAEATSYFQKEQKKQELENLIKQQEYLMSQTKKNYHETEKLDVETRNLHEYINSQIEKNYAEAAFNKRRASGISKGRNYGGGLNFHKDKNGWSFGLNGNYGYNDTY